MAKRVAKTPKPLAQATRKSVKITKSNETVSEYVLEDGTKLLVRMVLLGVNRVVGHYNEKGDPLYEISGVTVVDAKAPAKLKKK